MENFFDKLGLRPSERRLLMGVGVALFIILNIYLVWPHFSDWKKLQTEIAAAEATLAQYQAEEAKLPEYQAREAALKGDGPAILTTADMSLALIKVVQPKAGRAGINVVQWTPSKGASASNSEFFEEHTLRISFRNTGDKALLKFLVSLGEGDSVIRIRDLAIRPESSRMKLTGSLTMVASYQKVQ